MIDLVFLLLIFFMVSSRLVTMRNDPRVRVPLASGSIVPKDASDRVVVNIYADGKVGDEDGLPLDLDGVTNLMRASKAGNPNVRLFLRADRETEHENVKKVIDAAAEGGVKNVIFSTEQ